MSMRSPLVQQKSAELPANRSLSRTVSSPTQSPRPHRKSVIQSPMANRNCSSPLLRRAQHNDSRNNSPQILRKAASMETKSFEEVKISDNNPSDKNSIPTPKNVKRISNSQNKSERRASLVNSAGFVPPLFARLREYNLKHELDLENSKNSDKDNNVYILEVTYTKTRQKWKLEKTLTEFQELDDELRKHHKDWHVKLPACPRPNSISSMFSAAPKDSKIHEEINNFMCSIIYRMSGPSVPVDEFLEGYRIADLSAPNSPLTARSSPNLNRSLNAVNEGSESSCPNSPNPSQSRRDSSGLLQRVSSLSSIFSFQEGGDSSQSSAALSEDDSEDDSYHSKLLEKRLSNTYVSPAMSAPTSPLMAPRNRRAFSQVNSSPSLSRRVSHAAEMHQEETNDWEDVSLPPSSPNTITMCGSPRSFRFRTNTIS